MKLFACVAAMAGCVLMSATFAAHDDGKSTDKQPVELGQVKWHRDLEKAKKKAASLDRPIFLLFQEVPG